MGWTDNNGVYHRDPGDPKDPGVDYAEQSKEWYANPAGYLQTHNGQRPSFLNTAYGDANWQNVMKPTAFEYGGRRGVAQQEENRYEGLAGAAMNRAAPQQDLLRYGDDMRSAQQFRNQQDFGLNRLRDISNRGYVTPAQQQLQQGFQQGLAGTQSAVAGARGGGGSLVAAQGAGADAAAAQTAAYSNNLAQLKANEYAQATQAYGQAATQQRGTDIQAQGLAGDVASRQAQLEAQQRQQNDQRSLGYEQMRRDVFNNQMAAQQSGEAANSQAFAANAKRRQEQAAADQQEINSYVNGIVTAGGTVLGSVGSDVRNKRDIGDGAPAVRQQLAAMVPYTYQYKNPEQQGAGPGPRVGVMAQDMEKGPYGKQLVKNTPQGKKIDGPGGLSLALAGVADQEKRLQALEAQQKPSTRFEKYHEGNSTVFMSPEDHAALYPSPAPVPQVNVGGPARPAPRRPPPTVYGPTPTAQEIASSYLPPRYIEPVGPTPTADDIAAQYLPPTAYAVGGR